VELWRARHGSSVRSWLDAVGQLEALLAFSEHAFEHPDHVFPEIVDAPVCFEAEALGHPLLPSSRCVRNDLSIGGGDPSLVLLSGSNMSGKSTLLRAVGVATILALAGALVRARRLRVSALSIGASIRVGDSVVDGVSRFMFEITRLRRNVAIAEAGAPTLFLLDEVLGGTKLRRSTRGRERPPRRSHRAWRDRGLHDA
jgi:DNA mismatch repair ATPase MutS